jgi:phosphatidylglycerol---prolipoprotein diacylglyceryl transferase
MQPEIDLFGLSLKTFGLLFGLGFLAAGAVLARRLIELGKQPDWAYEIIFAGLIGGVVGSRLWWLAENPDRLDDLGSVFGGSGLVWYGGAIGGALGVVLWARRRGMMGVGLLDLCAPGLAIGYAIGRIGCQVSGDGDYGEPWSGPWAMGYEDGVVPTDPGELVHPTPIYETLSMGLAALVLWHLRDRLAPGRVFALYLVLAGAERLLVEFVRRNEAAVAGLTPAQLISVAMLAAGVVWLWRTRPRALPPATA